jgi:GGDEF domain-containing protein/tetratricopeptide (TPR) repeat protein
MRISGGSSVVFGLLTEDLPSKLAKLKDRLSLDDPLADRGEAAQLLIELGEHQKAGAQLETAMRESVDGASAEHVLVLHLLRALTKALSGQNDMARRFLERALVIQAGRYMMPIELLKAVVGVQVNLMAGDFAEAESFVRDIEKLYGQETESVMHVYLTLWKAEIAMRRGDLVLAEGMLGALPASAEKSKPVESTWRVAALRGEIELSRGNRAQAMKHFEESVACINAIAGRLAQDFRKKYTDSRPRRAVFARLEDLKRRRTGLVVRGGDVMDSPAESGLSPELLTAFSRILDETRGLGQERDVEVLLGMVLDAMIQFCGAQRGMVALVENGEVHVESGRHREGRALNADELHLSRTIALKVAREGTPAVFADASFDSSLRLKSSVVGRGVKSVLCVPLTFGGRTQGSIYLDDPSRADAFSPQMVQVAQVLASHAALAIDHARLLSAVSTDNLTGARSHVFFQEQATATVALSKRHGRSCGLIIFDFDNFKELNDAYGHEFGSQVLKQTLDNLRASLRASDAMGKRLTGDRNEDGGGPEVCFGRFGGDEFEIFLPETGAEGLKMVAERLLKGVGEQLFAWKGGTVRISVSIGGACFPDHADGVESLFRAADEALYRAKREGRGRFCMAGRATARTRTARKTAATKTAERPKA